VGLQLGDRLAVFGDHNWLPRFLDLFEKRVALGFEFENRERSAHLISPDISALRSTRA
jgi:hypothetical protein